MKHFLFFLFASLLTNSSFGARLLDDDFESYTPANCTQADCGNNSVDNEFVNGSVGWTAANADNITGSGQSIISIETSIPGFTGSFPGENSSQVFRIEQPNDGGTNGYVQFMGSDRTAVPGDVWFQFWIYQNYYGSELSYLENRFKLIYPSIDGSYPNWPLWLFSMANDSYCDAFCTIDPEDGGYIVNRDSEAVGQANASDCGDNEWKLGPNENESCVTHNAAIGINTWHLVKIHMDTSSSTTGGTQEVWIAPQGGEFVKYQEWIHGTTPNFTWTGFSEGGHYGFDLFSTNGWTVRGDANYYYLDDFVMAESESDLPVYDAVAEATGLVITLGQ